MRLQNSLSFTLAFRIHLLLCAYRVYSATDASPDSACRWQLPGALALSAPRALHQRDSRRRADVDLELVHLGPLEKLPALQSALRGASQEDTLDEKSSGRERTPERPACWRLGARPNTRLSLVIDNHDFNSVVSGLHVFAF